MPTAAPESIRLLCLDVDGVLTDGGIHLDDHGLESKRFHVRDGTGIRIWKRLGLEIALLTGRKGMVVRHRASELGIELVVQGSGNKLADFTSLLRALNLRASEAAMLGDDLPDLGIMKLAGYPMAVADAVPEIRAVAEFVTVRPGGHGAVREAIEHLLQVANRWNEARAFYE